MVQIKNVQSDNQKSTAIPSHALRAMQSDVINVLELIYCFLEVQHLLPRMTGGSFQLPFSSRGPGLTDSPVATNIGRMHQRSNLICPKTLHMIKKYVRNWNKTTACSHLCGCILFHDYWSNCKLKIIRYKATSLTTPNGRIFFSSSVGNRYSAVFFSLSRS